MPPPQGGQPGGANPFQVSEADLQSLYGYLQNLDDKELKELEDLSKQMLSEMGFDPETLQPLPADAQKKPATEPKPPATVPVPHEQPAPPKLPVMPQEQPSEQTLKQIPVMLQSLIDHFSFLIGKAAASRSVKQAMQRWETDIKDMLFFLKAVNKPHHRTRLATPEFKRLVESLMRLNTVMGQYEPLVVTVEKTGDWDDPYELLGIFGTADEQEITRAYEKIKARRGPDAVRARLEKSSLTPQERERELKRAALGFELITDAYDQLKDPKSRAIVDKERAALESARRSTQGSALQALDAILRTFGNALYQDQLLNNLEAFLKKYEPQELELRKQQLEREAKEKKKLEEEAKRKPEGKIIETGRKRPGGGYMPWEKGPYGPDYYDGRYRPPFGPAFRPGTPGGLPEPLKPTTTGGGAPADKKAQEAAAAKEAKKKEQEKLREIAAKKVEKKLENIDKLITELEINLPAFNIRCANQTIHNALKFLSSCQKSSPEELDKKHQESDLDKLRDEAEKLQLKIKQVEESFGELKPETQSQMPGGKGFAMPQSQFGATHIAKGMQPTAPQSSQEKRWLKLKEEIITFKENKKLIDAAAECLGISKPETKKPGAQPKKPSKQPKPSTEKKKPEASADIQQQTADFIDAIRKFNTQADAYITFFTDAIPQDQNTAQEQEEKEKEQRISEMLAGLQESIDAITDELRTLIENVNQETSEQLTSDTQKIWSEAQKDRDAFAANLAEVKQTLTEFSGHVFKAEQPKFLVVQLEALEKLYAAANDILRPQESTDTDEQNTDEAEKKDSGTDNTGERSADKNE